MDIVIYLEAKWCITEGTVPEEYVEAMEQATDEDTPIFGEDGSPEQESKDDMSPELRQHIQEIQTQANEQVKDADEEILRQLEKENGGELTEADIDKLLKMIESAEQRVSALEAVEKEYDERVREVQAEVEARNR